VENFLQGEIYHDNNLQRSVVTPSKPEQKLLLAAVSAPPRQEIRSLEDAEQVNRLLPSPTGDEKQNDLIRKPLPDKVVLEKILDDDDDEDGIG